MTIAIVWFKCVGLHHGIIHTSQELCIYDLLYQYVMNNVDMTSRIISYITVINNKKCIDLPLV